MFDVSVFIFISDHESATKLAVIKANLTEERNLLIANLTEERNLLIANLTEVTEELKRLQRLAKKSECHFAKTHPGSLYMYNSTHFPLTFNALSLTFLTEKACPAGWRMLHCSCYHLSTKSASWEGRKDCRARGADLVVIDSPEKQVRVTLVHIKCCEAAAFTFTNVFTFL
uniref:C-type lectin domain-containing protein n=1 Tax=Echeneis naucrates TaxID=173247 RepID=A0A665X3T9_ECHNA